MLQNYWRDIEAIYQDRRDKAKLDVSRKHEEIYRLYPEISCIDDEIANRGVSFVRKLINDAHDTGIHDFSENLSALEEKKLNLLEKYGYPRDYLQIQYQCNKCTDTGFVSDTNGLTTGMCNCLKQLLLERIYSNSNVNCSKGMGFEFFSEDLYSQESDQKKYSTSISPRQQALHIKSKCIDFINNFESAEQKNLFFFGPTGVGKTFFSKSIALEVIRAGHTALYLTAPELFDIIYRLKYKKTGDESNFDFVYNNIMSVELLVIDDLGTESPSSSKYAELLTILNNRSSLNNIKACKTIISSNLGLDKLYDIYSERVASRIIGEFELCSLFGDDIRIIRSMR